MWVCVRRCLCNSIKHKVLKVKPTPCQGNATAEPRLHHSQSKPVCTTGSQFNVVYLSVSIQSSMTRTISKDGRTTHKSAQAHIVTSWDHGTTSDPRWHTHFSPFGNPRTPAKTSSRWEQTSLANHRKVQSNQETQRRTT